MRAALITEFDQPGSAEGVLKVLERHRARLVHASENSGCGCCVDIRDVEGPADLIASIPPASLADSKWVKSDAPSEEKPV